MNRKDRINLLKHQFKQHYELTKLSEKHFKLFSEFVMHYHLDITLDITLDEFLE